jgi:PKD repeat protein
MFFHRSLSLFFAGMLSVALQAQDQVIRNTNLQGLENIRAEFQTFQKANRDRIEAYVKEKKILKNHFLPNGTVVSLVGFDEFGHPLYQRTLNNSTAAATISTNRVHPSATVASRFNLTGRGMIVGEWDGGTNRITHREYEGRAIQKDNGSMPVSEHATHVGGTIMAGGAFSPAVRGMAYQSTLWANDWESDDIEMAQAAQQGLLVSNHSYGMVAGWNFNESTNQWEWNGADNISTQFDYKFGFYDSRARNWDRIATNAPYYLIVKSAGNSRGGGPNNAGTGTVPPANGPYDCIPTYSVAKNILTVGAVRGLANGYSAPTGVNGVVMSDFSSWGPADDGRIKPDIVGCGVAVTSLGSASDVQTVELQGTSMSAPTISGSCLLLQEMYSNTHKQKKMRSSTLKGLVIHTADECWNFTGPDYRFGWGLMNTSKAATVIYNDSVTSLIREAVLNNQETREITVTAKGNEPLVATVCWTDPAGTPGPAALNSRLKMLVNDLDVRLINNSSQAITLPWRLNPDSVTSAARKNDNSVDNVEKIELPNPVAGQTYTIRVSHKGTLVPPVTGQPAAQPYSLIVSGVVAGDTAATCLPHQAVRARSGVFTDGSGAGRNYAANADCQWVVTPADSDAVVQLVFRSFSVQPGDTLYVYSGTDASGILKGKFSGTSLPDTLYSLANNLFLNFRTNGSGQSAGWEVFYQSLPLPKFDFRTDSRTICSGGSSSLTVQAINGPVSDWTYNWSFPGAQNESSTAASPVVTYPNPGVYNITLTIANRAGSSTVVKNGILTVLPQLAANTAPYFEGFEAPAFPVNSNPAYNWTITADPNTWTRSNLAPYSGVQSLRIRNETLKKDIRELISPAFDISQIPQNLRTLSFFYAFARKSTTTAADQLRLLISTNCGKTWQEVYRRSNTTNPRLSTIGDTPNDIISGTFAPESFQYKKDSVSLSALPANTQNFIFKFEMTSERGNFLYLDHVSLATLFTNVSTPLASESGFSAWVLPNPSPGKSRLRIQNPKQEPLEWTVSDIMGRTLQTRTAETGVGGDFELADGATLQPGTYLIRVRSVSEQKTIRWVVSK